MVTTNVHLPTAKCLHSLELDQFPQCLLRCLLNPELNKISFLLQIVGLSGTGVISCYPDTAYHNFFLDTINNNGYRDTRINDCFNIIVAQLPQDQEVNMFERNYRVLVLDQL